jgi:hypothetical protein
VFSGRSLIEPIHKTDKVLLRLPITTSNGKKLYQMPVRKRFSLRGLSVRNTVMPRTTSIRLSKRFRRRGLSVKNTVMHRLSKRFSLRGLAVKNTT